jgi:DNA-binding MarR family transcriptional regulator
MSTNVGSNYTRNFFKIANKIAQQGKLMTDQEFRLISYYTSFPTSWTFRTEKIMEDLQWSKSKVERTRVSLQKNGYLLIRRLPKNDFIYYIGKPAVRAYLLDKQKRENVELTNEELEILNKTEIKDDKIIFSEGEEK